MILSLALFSIGVFCYTVKELQSHGKLKWMASSIMSYGHGNFWGSESWKRKWKWDNGKTTKKEAFPGSSTVFVWLTDGYHLMQFFYIKLFILSIVLYDSVFRWWIDGLIFLATWYIIFNIIYKTFSK